MTTAWDVIARCWDDKGELGEQNADVILRALLSAPDSVRLELAAMLNPWRPMSEAKKNGESVLLKLKSPIPEPDRDDLRPFDGLYFVGRCPDSRWGWNFAAPVGMGGFPDYWFEGWLPLPAPPSEEKA